MEPCRRRRQRRLVGCARGAGDALRNLLVSALRLRPSPRHERRRCPRSHAGILHLTARAERLRAFASGARTLSGVPARIASALSRQRCGPSPHAEARRRPDVSAARLRRSRRALPDRAGGIGDTGDAVRTPLGADGHRSRPERAASRVGSGWREAEFDELKSCLLGVIRPGAMRRSPPGSRRAKAR